MSIQENDYLQIAPVPNASCKVCSGWYMILECLRITYARVSEIIPKGDIELRRATSETQDISDESAIAQDLMLNQERSGDEAIIFSLETELYEAKTKMEEFAADQEKLRTREAKAAVEIQSLRSKNEEFRMELQDKAQELENLEADIEKLRMDVELQSLKNDEFGMQFQGREDELEKVGNTATELLANIEKLKADQRNLRSREAEKTAELRCLRSKNEELRMKLQDNEGELSKVGASFVKPGLNHLTSRSWKPIWKSSAWMENSKP
ncbi:hypothetical protein B0H14DRAFT_3756982 [Mycena olivaceomarginata]|nr:hypothetical protein B0H14DRAFT_3756982 [Mycena olivaceomarginata]